MRCEFVGRSARLRGRCPEEAGGFSASSNGMDLLPYCVDCGRNLCWEHLGVHVCAEMHLAGRRRGDAVSRYREEMEMDE